MIHSKQQASISNSSLYVYRNAHTVLKISGERVLDYLQGQITQDINKITSQTAIYAAVLTPQGKTISDLVLMHGKDNEIIIICSTSSAENLVYRLRQFMLGYVLRLGIVSSMGIISLQGDTVNDSLAHIDLPSPDSLELSIVKKDNAIILRKTEASAQGVWLIAERTELAARVKRLGEGIEESIIESARIIHGTSRFGIDWDESVFPLNANLIESEGVCFEKGCYVGQEITSRMHWRKSIKKSLYHVQLSKLPSSLPCPVSTSAVIGTLTSAACNQNGEAFGIAHLMISAVESKQSLTFEDHQSLQILALSHA